MYPHFVSETCSLNETGCGEG